MASESGSAWSGPGVLGAGRECFLIAAKGFFVLQSIIIKKIPQTTPSHSGGLLTPDRIIHELFHLRGPKLALCRRDGIKYERMTAGKYPVSELQDKRELLLGSSNTVAVGKMNENREFHTHTTGVMNLALKLVILAASLSAEATVEVTA